MYIRHSITTCSTYRVISILAHLPAVYQVSTDHVGRNRTKINEYTNNMWFEFLEYNLFYPMPSTLSQFIYYILVIFIFLMKWSFEYLKNREKLCPKYFKTDSFIVMRTGIRNKRSKIKHNLFFRTLLKQHGCIFNVCDCVA